MTKEYFGVIGLLISVSAIIPYAYESIKGKVRPERISFLLWTMLGATYFYSSVLEEGAKIYTFGELLGPGIGLVLAVKYGVGGKSRLDLISLLVALFAFSLLFTLEGALVSLVLALVIDSIGSGLTIRKLYIDPSSESRLSWGMTAVSAVFALLSLRVFTFETIAFPAYVLLISSFIAFKSAPKTGLNKNALESL